MLSILLFVTCGLSEIAWTQPQLAVQNSGNTNTQQLNNIQGYQTPMNPQEQYQQDVNQQNAVYAYQDEQLPNDQMYQNSINQQPGQLYQQPEPTQYYGEQQTADTQYAYNGQQPTNTQDQQEVYPQQVPNYSIQNEYQSNTAPQNLQLQNLNGDNSQYYSNPSQPQDQWVSPTQIQSRSDTVPAQSRFSSMMSKITEFIMAFFNSEGTARKDPGFAAILSLSSLIIGSILYI